MKKTICLCTLAAIVAFCAGFLVCQNTTVQEKNVLIDAQSAALKQADTVMSNNDLWDADGSDDMAEYLELSCKVDSLQGYNL